MAKTIRRQKYEHEDDFRGKHRQAKSVRRDMRDKRAVNEETDSIQQVPTHFMSTPPRSPARVTGGSRYMGDGHYASRASHSLL